jgi:hypothetical protein
MIDELWNSIQNIQSSYLTTNQLSQPFHLKFDNIWLMNCGILFKILKGIIWQRIHRTISQLQNSKALMIVTFINMSTINLRADKHLGTVEGFKEQQPPIVVPPYWYGRTHMLFQWEH